MSSKNITGYLHPLYAASFAEFGTPSELPECGGWILERKILGFPYRDAMGCYPLFACKDWTHLSEDIKKLEGDLVSLSMVTDPFGNYDTNLLRKCFQDIVYPYKEHFIVDLHYPINSIVSKHHGDYARKALKVMTVELCLEPSRYINDWVNLYSVLIARHDIKGIARISLEAFSKQLDVPGIVVFRAVHEGDTVGMVLWYTYEDRSYPFLGAYSSLGYELHSSYALLWFAIDYFKNKVQWLDLGASAGVKNITSDGLAQFKKGWSTGTRTVYFCGRILNPKRYKEILLTKQIASNDYFPAYRYGEYN